MPVNSEIHDDGRQMLAGHLSTVHAVVSKLATLDLAAVVDGVALIRTTGRYAVGVLADPGDQLPRVEVQLTPTLGPICDHLGDSLLGRFLYNRGYHRH